jgi:CBS domain containing-hemolysin-like protein
VLNTASELLLRLVGLGNLNNDELTHTADELRLIVEHSVEGGHLTRNERVMIENVLNLEDKTARRIMVPRPDIVYLSLSRPIEDNLRVARQAAHTRFPLCETDLNTVIGMIHVKDLFQAVISQSNLRPDLRKLARAVPCVPESQHLDQLLIQFQRNRVHLAMIVDEYGSTIGMVSLENVLEELVGPIQDEFDRETPAIEHLGDNIYDVDASCPLDRLAETIDIDLPETDSETTGGFMLEQLGRLGRPGDSVSFDSWRLVIVQADPNRIRRLRLEPDVQPEGGLKETGA